MKLKAALLTIVALGTFGVLTEGTSEHAATSDIAPGYINSSHLKTYYVVTKKSLSTNLYRNVNGQKIRYIIPRGKKMLIYSTNDYRNNNHQIVTIASLNLDHYSYKFKSSFTNFKKNEPLEGPRFKFKSNLFKINALKPVLVGENWERGVYSPFNHTAHPVFNLTADGYIQFYNTADVKKADMDASTVFFNCFKPTTYRKIIKAKTIKNVTYVYYAKPITGLAEHKIQKGLYRLKINTQEIKSHNWASNENFYNAIWQPAYVGGKQYFNVIDEMGGD